MLNISLFITIGLAYMIDRAGFRGKNHHQRNVVATSLLNKSEGSKI